MRSAAIICPGPSLDPTIIPTLHEQCDMVVAVNRGYRAWDRYEHLHPDMVYLADGPHRFKPSEHCRMAELESVFAIYNFPKYIKEWKGILEAQILPLNMDENRAYENVNPLESAMITGPKKTVLLAWQSLARLRFDLILIAGCDGICNPDQRYFFSDKQIDKHTHKRESKSYGVSVQTLKHWMPLAEQRGIRTLNISGEASALSAYMESIEPTGITQWIKDNQARA